MPKRQHYWGARKLWTKINGPIPHGYEIHHIIPDFAGGETTIDNLCCVTPEEHAKMHLDRYKVFGDFRDLCAYHMIGYNFTEAHRISSSAGGKIGGKLVFEKKIGIFRNDEDRRQWASAAGKIGGKSQFERGLGFHKYRGTKKHLEHCSLGGKTSGVFQDKSFQSEMGRRGGKKNLGSRWYHDGTKSFKYTTEMMQSLPFDDFLRQHPEFQNGRAIHETQVD